MRSPRNPKFRRQQLSEILRFSLRSNALVDIADGAIRVHGIPLETIGPARVVFIVLANHTKNHPGESLTAEEILATVATKWSELKAWSLSQPRTLVDLNLAMWNLRKALKRAGQNPAIAETLRRRFYRLSVPSVNINFPGLGAD